MLLNCCVIVCACVRVRVRVCVCVCARARVLVCVCACRSSGASLLSLASNVASDISADTYASSLLDDLEIRDIAR